MAAIYPGVYEYGDVFQAKTHALGFVGTYDNPELARAALRYARVAAQSDKAKANTARDKKTKTKKDLIVWNLRMARNQLLSRGW